MIAVSAPKAALPPHRPIRSFVRREGRMTLAQRRALAQWWPRYGIDLPVEGAPAAAAPIVLDLAAAFQRAAPTILEIGFGNGAHLHALAQQQPQHNFLGIEVHRPGVGHLLQQLAADAMDNVRVICADASETLTHAIAPASFDAAYVLFPDPWPKKRHHKRRLLQTEFAALLVSRLKPGALLHVATDWEDYAHATLAVLSAFTELENLAGAGQFAPRPTTRAPTKFERRGERLGHGVWDLSFRRRV